VHMCSLLQIELCEINFTLFDNKRDITLCIEFHIFMHISIAHGRIPIHSQEVKLYIVLQPLGFGRCYLASFKPNEGSQMEVPKQL
jgi:hypothetical protein